MDKRALDSAMGYWNKGIKKYLSAGSDQHDVTSGLYPGIIRLYAYIEGENTTEKYLQTIKDGHSYVTMGPIFTPKANTMFGTTQKVNVGEKYKLNTEIQAVNGLNHIDVYSEGKIIESKDFNNTQDAVNYTLDVEPTKNTWYSFVATDGKGHYAVTNPIWVEIADDTKSQGQQKKQGQQKSRGQQKNQGQQKTKVNRKPGQQKTRSTEKSGQQKARVNRKPGSNKGTKATTVGKGNFQILYIFILLDMRQSVI